MNTRVPVFPLRFACALVIRSLPILIVSCGAPFLERAVDPPGQTSGFGLGTIVGLDPYGLNDNPPYFYWDAAGFGFHSWPVSEQSRVSLLGLLACDLPINPGYLATGGITGIVELGYKYQTGEHDAVKGIAGLMLPHRRGGLRCWPILSVGYLHDFGAHFTGRITLGTDLIGIAVNYRYPLSSVVDGCLALGAGWPGWTYVYVVPGAASLGVGVSLHRLIEEEQGRE